MMGTQLTIGKIDIGLLNRIIIDDLLLNDRSGREMLKIKRLSATFDLPALIKGKMAINSVQLFGFNIKLNKQTADSKPNFQFLIDTFAQPDSLKKSEMIDLRINSILMRRGRIAYDVESEAETPERFNPQHIRLQNIIANISLKALQTDSIHASIKRLSADEGSGLTLKKLSMKLVANNKKMHIDNFLVDLPGSSLQLDTIRVNYDSLEVFKQFTDQVHFSFRTLPSHITLQDFAPFVPAFSHFKEKIDLELDVNGTVNQLICSKLKVSAGHRLQLMGDGSLQDLSHPESSYLFGHLSHFSVSQEGVEFLMRNLGQSHHPMAPTLMRLGAVSYSGEISGYFTDLVTYGVLQTELGTLQTDLKLSSERETGLFSYSGGLKTAQFQLGKLLDNSLLGNTTFNLNVQGTHPKQQHPSILLKGLIQAFEYSHYTYENITLDGEYIKGGFKGQVALNDVNGSVRLNGNVNLATPIPTFDFLAEIERVRPHDLHLTKSYADAAFSVKVRANFTGDNIDRMVGEINIDSFHFTAPEKEYFMRNLHISASKTDTINKLQLTSEFMTADVEGRFHFQTLPASVLSIMSRYLPSLLPPPQRPERASNNFTFDIHLFNSDLLSTVFDIPLKINAHSTIKGYCNDAAGRLRIEGYFPQLQYQNSQLESGLFICENPLDQFRAHARFSTVRKSGAVNVSLNAQAKEDQLTTSVNWGNSAAVTYSGELASVARFFRTKGEKPLLNAIIDIQPSNVILNDTLWQLHASQVVVDSGHIDVNNFLFSHKDRFIRINGRASESERDTIRVNLKEINVGYVFDMANLQGVKFEGDATGTAYASGVLKNPALNTRLFIRRFSFNSALLGDLNISGAWQEERKAILVDAVIQDGTRRRAHIDGYIYPIAPASGLDLHIDADSLNINFVEEYTKVIVQDIQGRGSGKVHLYGNFNALNLDGAVATNASLKLGMLNTSFTVNDSIHLKPTGVYFNQIAFSDLEDHNGTLNGYLQFQHFNNLNYRLDIDVENMLVMNTKESIYMPFYGTVYGTGNALITGNAQGVDVNVGMTTNRNTTFTYTTASTLSAASNQFVRFVDKTEVSNQRDSIRSGGNYEASTEKLEKKVPEADIRLNILVDVTPEANVKMVMDPIAGDYISGHGSGNIRAEYYNKGEIKMFGNYHINQGVYKFSLQEVIRKDFIIKNGSSVTFNGPPLQATLNVQAAYTVPSASLNDLIPEASTLVQQPNVRVHCMMNLTGNLLRPSIKFDLEIPNEREEIQTLVRNYINTDEQMNMQILYLLGIGKFYMQDNTNTNQRSGMMSSVLSSTLSGQLNNMLSQIINNNNWNFGTNVSTGEKGFSELEAFEGILSAQLLNNRLLINGNFGYRDNPMANTNFVGDFEAEWLLNRSGEIRLKAYNETNDRYYTKTNLTTQGIGILFKKEFNKWNELFFWNRWKLKRTQKEVKGMQMSTP